jgi:hypothetical protein
MANLQDITLTPNQQAALARIAAESGKSWPDVFTEALEEYQATHNGQGKKRTFFGVGKGVAVLADDFDAPLPEFKDYME